MTKVQNKKRLVNVKDLNGSAKKRARYIALVQAAKNRLKTDLEKKTSLRKAIQQFISPPILITIPLEKQKKEEKEKKEEEEEEKEKEIDECSQVSDDYERPSSVRRPALLITKQEYEAFFSNISKFSHFNRRRILQWKRPIYPASFSLRTDKVPPPTFQELSVWNFISEQFSAYNRARLELKLRPVFPPLYRGPDAARSHHYHQFELDTAHLFPPEPPHSFCLDESLSHDQYIDGDHQLLSDQHRLLIKYKYSNGLSEYNKRLASHGIRPLYPASFPRRDNLVSDGSRISEIPTVRELTKWKQLHNLMKFSPFNQALIMQNKRPIFPHNFDPSESGSGHVHSDIEEDEETEEDKEVMIRFGLCLEQQEEEEKEKDEEEGDNVSIDSDVPFIGNHATGVENSNLDEFESFSDL